MTRDRSFKDLRQLSSDPLNLIELARLLGFAHDLEPRAAVLVIVSQLETALERALLTKLSGLDSQNYERLFGEHQPLSNFYLQIWVASAVGLFGCNTRADLEELRHIRNAFAHASRHVDFSTKAVADHAAKMTLPVRAVNVVPNVAPRIWPPTNTQQQVIETAFAYWEAFMDIASEGSTIWPLD